MSIQALNSAITGMKAAQQMLALASRNVSNANTQGYTRKTLPQEAVFAGPDMSGVITGQIQRSVDMALARDYWQQNAAMTNLDTQVKYLDKIQQLEGTPDSETSLSAQISNLANAFETLSSAPDSLTLQSAVVTQATTVAQQMNTLSNALSTQRNNTQDEMTLSVQTINDCLTGIAECNCQIAAGTRVGSSTADMEDQRDVFLKKLSAEMDISFYIRADDRALVVQTRSGTQLADLSAREVCFNPVQLSATSSWPASAASVLVGDPVSGEDITDTAIGGRLGALVTLRDSALPQQQAQLDELAQKMAALFDANGLTLFTDHTGAVPSGTAGTYAGFAADIEVNTAVAADPSLVQSGTAAPPSGYTGDTTLILSIINQVFGQSTAFETSGLGPDGSQSTGLPATATLEDYARALVTSQANACARASSNADSTTTYCNALEQKLANGSSVDLDQEMAAMMEFQRYYAASAKMMTAISEMFDQLLDTIR